MTWRNGYFYTTDNLINRHLLFQEKIDNFKIDDIFDKDTKHDTHRHVGKEKEKTPKKTSSTLFIFLKFDLKLCIEIESVHLPG